MSRSEAGSPKGVPAKKEETPSSPEGLLTAEEAKVAATLVDLMKNDLPPHISEKQQVAAYLALRRIASGEAAR